MAQEPLGVRLNNPLNIRATAEQWNGSTGADAGFVRFSNPFYGLRAGDRILQTYARDHGAKTVADVVSRWAPPTENDTTNYVNFVAGKLGVESDEEIDLSNPTTRATLLSAMANMEVGRNYSPEMIEETVAMLNRGATTAERAAEAPQEEPTEPAAPERHTLTFQDIQTSPELREQGYTVGDTAVVAEDGSFTDLERVYSDGSLAEIQGEVVTPDMLASSVSLNNINARVGDVVYRNEDGDLKLRRSDRWDTYKQFMYGIDKTGSDVENWGAWLESRIPLGRLSFQNIYESPTYLYGDDFMNASTQERRELILQSKQRALLDEYGYGAFDLESRPEFAQSAGGLVSSLLTPTTLAPVGRGLRAGAAIGAGIGAETVAGEQLAQTGQVRALPVLGTAVIGGALGGALGYATKASSLNIFNRAQAAVNEAVSSGVSPEKAMREAVRVTNRTPEQINAAARLAGREIVIPNSVEAAEEAIKNTITKDSAMGRLFSPTLDKYLGSISTRIRNISEPIFGRLRDFEFRTHSKTADYLQRVAPFVEGFSRLPEQVKIRASRHLFNRNYAAARAELNAAVKGLGDTLDEVTAVLDNVADEMADAGMVFERQPGYFTRRVTDLQALRASLGREERNFIDAQLEKYKRLKGKDYVLSQAEKEAATDKILDGFTVTARKGGGATWVRKATAKPAPSALKKRTIDEVGENQVQFYMSPDEALPLYIRRMVDEVETRRFFGKDLTLKQRQKMVLDDLDGLDRDSSVGSLLQRVHGDDLTDAQKDTIQELIKSRFVGGAQSPGAITSTLRDLGYLGTIANPISAITQLADIGASGAIYGVRNTLKALFGAKEIKQIDLGIGDVISQEFTNPKLSGRILEKMFRVSGFKAIDRLGKETTVNAAINRARGLARTTQGRETLRKKWGNVFGKEFDTLADDLARGDVTENVKFLAFNELADMQPIALSELPQAYLEAKNGRVLYMLKSFMLKQIDVVRRNVVQEWNKGNKTQAVKQAALLAGYLGTANAGTGVLKDALLGREVKPEQLPGRAMWGLLGVYGLSKYTADRYLANGQIKDAAVNMLVPATPILDSAFDLGADLVSGEAGENPLKYTKSVPVVGTIAYNWFGGGAEAYNKRNQ